MTLYQPFLDYGLDYLKSRLDISAYPIPVGFDRNSAVTGKGEKQVEVLTTSHAFQSPKLRQIRAAHVQGGPIRFG